MKHLIEKVTEMATRQPAEEIQEATDLYNKGGIQITRYSAGKGKLGVQVSTGYQKYIQLTEPQMKALASILPKLQRDLRKDLRSGVEYDEENTIEEDSMKDVSSADKKPQKFKKPDGTMGTRMVSADPKKAKPEEGKLDPVGQADADIDNDGDVDKSDKYLHNRRKAIKKAITKKKDPQGQDGETATMNPKKESTIRSKLLSILEGDRAKHYKGAAEAEEMEDKYKGAGAKKMAQDHKGPTVDIEKQSHDDASKAGRAVKSKAKARNGSDAINSGDQNIVNPVKDTTKAGKGESAVNEDIKKTIDAYMSMYEKKHKKDDEKIDEISSDKAMSAFNARAKKFKASGEKDKKQLKKLTRSGKKAGLTTVGMASKYQDATEAKLDELSPGLAQKAFDARAKKFKASGEKDQKQLKKLTRSGKKAGLTTMGMASKYQDATKK